MRGLTLSALALLAACTGGTDSAGIDGGSTDGGAGGGGTISASSFDQSCTVDTDCVTVNQGDVCSTCKCPSGLISKSALAAYDAKVKELSASCPPPTMACGVDCAEPIFHCGSGKCAFGPRDAGTD